MNVNQGLKRLMFKKVIVLVITAAALGILCCFANTNHIIPDYNNSHLIYTVISVLISILILALVAWKIRFFHCLFTKEFIGTVIDTKYERVGNYAVTSIKNLNNFAIWVQLDNSNEIIELRFPVDKISEKVYQTGDRIHRIKGTRYPINLTREAEQHICPICGRDSCLGDECPDCKIKY